MEQALQVRMRMPHGEAFMIDVFEAIRAQAGTKRWASPNEEVGCHFHFHEHGQSCEIEVEE